jgi:methylated-DNA-[protein]-cysteine S-methyltransferase
MELGLIQGAVKLNRKLLFPSELGWMVLCHNGHLVTRTGFGYPSRSSASAILDQFDGIEVQAQDAWEKKQVKRLQEFASGSAKDFSDIAIDESWMTEFQRKVVSNCRKVAYGQTVSYGQLAQRCGSKGAARAVGTVMANNRFPLIVPCHRVIASGGLIGGFSAPDGISMKRRLLSLERPKKKIEVPV